MRRVSILCLLMLFALLSHGFPGNAYAQLNKVTIVSPAGTSITSPQQGEYANGDSMNITWKDEHLVSGQDFLVRWTSLNATFTLKYSFDKITWQNIASKIEGSQYLWQQVPVVAQSRRCWIKVIGFDGNGQKNGTDTQLVYIRVRPAVNVNIFYSTNSGETWQPIDQVSYRSQYNWDVSMKSRKCRFGAQVKVVMKDGNDRTVGSAVSAKFTAISDQPPRLAGYWSGYYCCSPEGMSIPVSGTIDGENQYNFIGELPFGKAKFLGSFHGSCLDADDDGTLSITGDGTAIAPPGHPWSNGETTATIDLNAETNAAITAMQGSWTMTGSGSGDFHIDRE